MRVSSFGKIDFRNPRKDTILFLSFYNLCVLSFKVESSGIISLDINSSVWMLLSSSSINFRRLKLTPPRSLMIDGQSFIALLRSYNISLIRYQQSTLRHWWGHQQNYTTSIPHNLRIMAFLHIHTFLSGDLRHIIL